MSGTQQLRRAVDASAADEVRRLVAADPTLAVAKGEDGLSPLLAACYAGRDELVEALLAADPPTSIFEAAATGQTARVGELLARQPELATATASDGFTALHLAAYFGHLAVAERLLAAGADPAVVAGNATLVTPLHSALGTRPRTEASDVHAMVRLLLEHGAAVNATQQSGWTPLHQAVHRNDADLCRLLLEAGADPARPNDDGIDPRALALREGHLELLPLLAGNLGGR